MKSWLKSAAGGVGRRALRYTHLDSVTPATPRAYRLLREISKSNQSGEETKIIAENVSAKEFVDHWVQHGWTMPALVAAYGNLHRTAWSLFAIVVASIMVCLAHAIQAPKFQPVFTGTSIMAIGMFVFAYLHILMLMWRIRERRLNALAWPGYMMRSAAQWLPQALPEAFVSDLRKEYYSDQSQ